MTHIHIFRRDLRLEDNTALSAIPDINEHLNLNTEDDIHSSPRTIKQIIPLFIFTPQQVSDKNRYKSYHAVQFMIRSLSSLDKSIQTSFSSSLLTVYGDEVDVIRMLYNRLAKTNAPLLSISWNKDYTPYSKTRDNKISQFLKKHNIINETYHDLYLIPPREGIVYPASKTPEDVYTVFTPFYRNARDILKRHPPHVHPTISQLSKFLKSNDARFISASSLSSLRLSNQITLKEACKKFVGTEWVDPSQLNVEGGRENGVKRIQKIRRHQFEKYQSKRDQLTYETTYLSAYLKFGCVSVREAFYAMLKSKGDSEAMIRELLWRDYYGHVMDRYPHVIGKPYYEKYEKFKWETSRTKEWNAWKEGRTGFPVVDAGMRQMNATGYMHNRCRMIVSSFLVKLLRIDWRRGERYFAQTLEDYDVASNNGGWQDAFGSGAGAQPYYRIFNPWTQAKKFDKDAEYIRRWVPELEKVPSELILGWDDEKKRATAREEYGITQKMYPDPIVDVKEERAITLAEYKRL